MNSSTAISAALLLLLTGCASRQAPEIRIAVGGAEQLVYLPTTLAQQLGFWWAVTGLDYFFGYVDTMAKQSPSDLQAYADKYIIGKPHVVGVLVSPDMRRTLNLTPSALLEAGVHP